MKYLYKFYFFFFKFLLLFGAAVASPCQNHLTNMVFTGYQFDHQRFAKCTEVCQQFKTTESKQKHQWYDFKSVVLYHQAMCFCSSKLPLSIAKETREVKCASSACKLIKKLACREGALDVFEVVALVNDNNAGVGEMTEDEKLQDLVANKTVATLVEAIAAKDLEVRFTCSPWKEKSSQQTCFAEIKHVANASVTLIAAYEKKKKEVIIVDADPYVFTLETNGFSEHVKEIDQTPAVADHMMKDGFYLNSELMFDESGYLYDIKVNFEKPGPVEIWIVAPNSKTISTCWIRIDEYAGCPGVYDLTKSLNPMHEFRSIDNGVDMPQLNIKQVFIITSKSTGFQQIDLRKQNISVDKGDMIGFVVKHTEPPQHGQISFVASSTSSSVYPTDRIESSSASVPYKSSHTIPLMKLTLRKLLKVPITLKPATKTGYAKLTCAVKLGWMETSRVVWKYHLIGPLPPIKFPKMESEIIFVRNNTDSLKEKIDGISFQPGYPQKGYKNGQKSISIQMRVMKGSDIKYIYDIPSIGQYIETTSNEIEVDIGELMIGGPYNITVIAANKINAIKVETSFKILDEIAGFTMILPEPPVVRVNTCFVVAIHIQNGTDVTTDVAFGDSRYEVHGFFQNAGAVDGGSGNGVFYNYTYKYKKCGNYNITATAYNLINEAESSKMKREASINVHCDLAIDDLTINTFPALKNDQVWISKTRPLLLEVIPLIERSLLITIHWGDGTADQRNGTFGEVINERHVYGRVGMFKLQITASDDFGLITTPVTVINVTNCGPPLVNFNYGSPGKPVLFKSAMDTKISSVWLFDDECRTQIKPFFKFSKWVLMHANGTTIKVIMEDAYVQDDQTATLWIKARTLPIGNYGIKLVMTYKNMEETYLGFIEMTSSGIVARIVNGEFSTVPYAVLDHDGVGLLLNRFKLDAGVSRDFDNPRARTEGMEFEWSCRFVSSPEEKETAILNKKKSPLSRRFDGQEICTNRDWVGLNAMNTSVLELFSGNLLKGLQYDFRVRVTKDTRQNVAVQRLAISRHVTPSMKIVCKNNCEKKINTMERFVLHSECESCGSSLSLHAKWTIKSFDGEYLDDPNITRTGFNHRNLVIKPNQLLPNSAYNFTLMIGYTSEKSNATFTFTKQTSITPHSGSCNFHLQDQTDEPNDKRFRIWCENWINVDQPTTYEFYYNMEVERPDVLPLLNPGNEGLNYISNVLLPYGLAERNHQIDLIILIGNGYGQFHEYVLNVTVEPIEEDKATNMSSLAKRIIPQNTNNVASLATAVLVISHIFDFTKDDLMNGGATIDPLTGLVLEEDKHAAARRNEAVNERKRIKEKVIGYLEQADINSVAEVGSIAGALSSITKHPGDLTANSQRKSINLVSKLTSKLTVFQVNDEIEAGALERSLRTVFDSVSNLFTNEVNTVEQDTLLKTTSRTSSESAITSTNNLKSLVNSIDDGCTMLAVNQVEGEDATIGNTKTFQFGVQKASSSQMENLKIGGGGGGDSTGDDGGAGGSFKLPQGSDMFSATNGGGEISVLNVNYKNNIFVSDAAAKNIKSKVASLSFKSGKNSIKVNNTRSPITITLQNKPESFKTHNISFKMPGLLETFSLKLKSVDCQLMFNIKQATNNYNTFKKRLHVYGQYGEFPTTDSYDFRFMITSGEYSKLYVFNNQTQNNSSSSNGYNITRRINISQLDNNTLMMWGFNQHSLAYLNKTVLNLALWYKGDMPELIKTKNAYTFDEIESAGSLVYSLKSFCAECSYWNDDENLWKTDGCQLQRENTTLEKTECLCNHLTAFGSFFVAPNPLPTPSLALFKEGYTLFVAVGTILLLYVIGLILARRADLADRTKVGVCPIPDNKPEHKYLYEITVNTGSRLNAGTKSKVFIDVRGELGNSSIRPLYDCERTPFQRSSSNVFVMATESSLGTLQSIRIFHDNSGGGWYLRNIEVVDLMTDQKYVFLATRWLAVELQDGQIDCVFTASSQDQLKNFNYLFTNKAKRDFSDAHLWFSIYGRPPRSHFSRCQRLSVAVSLLLTTMLANVMFYGRIPPGSPASENKAGSFSINLNQVYIAVVSACICIPINILLVTLFRNIRPHQHGGGDTPATNGGGGGSGKPLLQSQRKPKNNEYHLVSLYESSDETHEYRSKVDLNMDYKDNVDTGGGGGGGEVYKQPVSMNGIGGVGAGRNMLTVYDSNDDVFSVSLLGSDEEARTASPYKEEQTLKNKESKSTSCFKKILKHMKKKSNKKKVPKYLPGWVIYPAWVLNVLVILGCSFMVIWYGMAFGNKKSLEWLTSVSIGLIQDILLMQPIKVLIMAMFVALIVKKLEDEERSEVEKQARLLARDDEWLHKPVNDAGSSPTKAIPQILCHHPPSKQILELARAARLKQLKMNSILKELAFYLFFCFVVLFLCSASRDEQGFRQTINTKEALQLSVRQTHKYLTRHAFHKTHKQGDVWDYFEEVLLPTMFPDPWYPNQLDERYKNASDVFEFPTKLTMSDLSSKIVTGTRLRQLRVQEDTCIKSSQIASLITVDCAGNYDKSSEQKTDYLYNWSKPIHYQSPIFPGSMPWRWQDPESLNGYPIHGRHDLYYGSGYVTSLFPRWKNSKILKKLKESLWLDRHSRALIVESVLFNAATNYFQNIAVVFEFSPTGGVTHYNSVLTFKLYRYSSQYATLELFCEIAFAISMLFFILKEAKKLHQMRMSYFTEFWNLVEIAIIVLSILAVGFYFYRDILVRDLFKRIPDKEPSVYISFQFAAYWDITYSSMLGMISFFVILKFIRIFCFNARISMLSSTLKKAWYPMSMFGIIFAIIMCACVIFANLIFGRQLYDYQSYFRTVASIIGLSLGKFSYHEFKEAHGYLGPVFFFVFNVMVNWIILNIFIAILNDAIGEVHSDPDLQCDDFEMVEYCIESFKKFIGYGTNKALDPHCSHSHKNRHHPHHYYHRNHPRSSRRRSRNRSSFLKCKIDYSFLQSPFFVEDVDKFIKGDHMDEGELNTTMDKFIGCVNILYFDDKEVAKKMHGVIKREIEQSTTNARCN